MLVLGIDTALGACSAAWLRGGEVLARRFEPMMRGHAERLFPMLNEVSAEAGVRLADADRIAVTVGPGSFTGTRTGLAAARGIALAAGRPAVGITTLRTVAAGAGGVPVPGQIAVLLDAGRGSLYGQLFDAQGAALTEPFAAPPAAVPERLAAAGDEALPLAVIGTGAQAALDKLRGWPGGVRLAPGNPLPDAALVARLGAAADPDGAPPVPLYLRPPDAVPASPVLAAR